MDELCGRLTPELCCKRSTCHAAQQYAGLNVLQPPNHNSSPPTALVYAHSTGGQTNARRLLQRPCNHRPAWRVRALADLRMSREDVGPSHRRTIGIDHLSRVRRRRRRQPSGGVWYEWLPPIRGNSTNRLERGCRRCSRVDLYIEGHAMCVAALTRPSIPRAGLIARRGSRARAGLSCRGCCRS